MSDDKLHIAIWEDPVTRVVAEMLDDSENQGVKGVSIQDPEHAMDELLEGTADVALLPTYTVLREIRSLDILPGVALSSSANPYATAAIENIARLDTAIISVEKGKELTGLVAEIILKEHYSCMSMRLCPDDITDEETIVAIEDSGTLSDSGFKLDLAREWYELVNYPLVWAVFVTRTGAATSEMIRIVRDTVALIDLKRAGWVANNELSEPHRHFYDVDLRYHLDDVAVASLSELCEYLYFYGDTEEIPTFSLASITSQEDE